MSLVTRVQPFQIQAGRALEAVSGISSSAFYGARDVLFVAPYVTRIQEKLARPDVDKDAVADLSRKVLSVRRLVHIMPEARFSDLHDQLILNEKVHPVQNPTDLLSHRLGRVGQNKDCQALIVATKQGQIILAQIFRFHAAVPLDQNGLIDPSSLPGNVDAIKSTPVKDLEGVENITGYWTISSVWRGSGPILVGDLQRAAKGRFETTISPVRDFTKTLERDKILPATERYGEGYIRYNVLKYFEAGISGEHDIDPVMRFHLSNGAFIGWVHVNSNSDKDWITVNYVYDRNLLDQNRALFKRGHLPVSEALKKDVSIGHSVISAKLAPVIA